MKESIFIDRIRDIFAMLDRVVYGLITIFYNTIVDIASVQIISGDQINEIANRVYALIGVFMLFKVSFSLINYIVDPNTIADKSKGGGALIKNIVITFVLIITVPFGFDMLYEAQSAILSDGIIPKFIFGDNGQTSEYSVAMDEQCNTTATTNNAGDYIGLMAFKPFFTVDENNLDDFGDISNMYCAGNSTGGSGNASVANLLKKSEVYTAPHGASVNKYYVIDYKFFISTAIGVVIALLMLSFCFDAATRMIKLLFLELIAPVPIISYIDPTSGKNGMFMKWIKEVGRTWLSLFIRLLAVYLAIYIIGMLSESELKFLSGYNFNGNMVWLKLLIIIGALIFAKELPKLVESILGLKLSGTMQLNPFKKLEKEALGFKEMKTAAGKVSVGAGAAGLAIAGSVIGHNRAKKKFASDNKKLDDNMTKKIAQIQSQRDKALNNATTSAERKAINKNFRRDLYGIKQETKESKEKLKHDYNKFSTNHPFLSGAATTARAAKGGYDKGAKKISDVMKNASDAAQNAAKVKIAHDKLSVTARIDDFVSDIAGARNESGTTSEIKRQIKQVTETLNDINNGISSLGYAIGDIQRTAPGSIIFDSNGKMGLNENYAWTNPAYKQTVQTTINQYNDLREAQKTRQKELNTLNDILSKEK